MQLRPYQQEAVLAVQRLWQDHRKLLVVLPTGTGKTICFANLAAEEHCLGNRTLIIAHRDELLRQAADKLSAATGLGCSIEKADEIEDDMYFVTVGSVQTLMREKRLARFSRTHYDVIIVDEAHHCLSDSYQRVLDYFSAARVLGVTATPDRGDKRNLGTYFDALAYEYSIRQAIAEGYLCKIVAQTVPLKIDLTQVRTKAGDYRDDDLATALDPYLGQIADEMVKTIGTRKTLCFLPLIATSQKFTAMLNDRGLHAVHVSGESEDRREILQRFARSEFQVLSNSMLLTEGYDQPDIRCIVCLRPTKIRSLYAQIVGRGTRICQGKENLLILDFLWHTQAHDLCHPAHLVAGSMEVADKMTAIQDAGGDPQDLMEMEEKGTSEAQKDREEALAKALKAQHKKQGRVIDPVWFSLSIGAGDLEQYEPLFPWQHQPATDKQLEVLANFGFPGHAIKDKGYAAMLLTKLMERRANHLATPRQLGILSKYGIPNYAGMSFEQATQEIDKIKKRGWVR